MSAKANERTFQGIFISVVNKILEKENSQNSNILFSNIKQEQNIGQFKQSRFADALLYSKEDTKKIILFEFKNTLWDATDDELVNAAAQKAFMNGYPYFVTGTPRQLVIWETFNSSPLPDRKYKSFTLSNVKKDNDILSTIYENEITSQLINFLSELSDIVHGKITKIKWDDIDQYFIKKLSEYILEATESMYTASFKKITTDKKFQEQLSFYFKEQDIFNVTQRFDTEDAYRICQLANYLLYLKILFYTHLQRDLPSLQLKELSIPQDINLLNQTLRSRFSDVLKFDFEKIFEENILEQLSFTPEFLPELSRNIDLFKKLNFSSLNVDVIGNIYNTLIDNQEQHDRGQHFTNINEVDIINAFCIDENTQLITDTACGAGTFLVRAYYFLKKYHPEWTHEELLEKIWGIEIAPFPVFLATMNLCLLDIASLENYPVIIQNDFSEVSNGYTYNGYFLNKTKNLDVKNINNRLKSVSLPMFDVCVGNPPYIRQELISNKESWIKLANQEWGIKKINQQSDLYVYYLMHTTSLLKEGGRLGYVIFSSWLDVSYGTGLQKFLLDNFKIIAVIENQKKRSFETASVNTVILIIEKCTGQENRTKREKNTVRFVKVLDSYENLIGKSQDEDRFEKVNKFTKKIEKITKNTKNEQIEILCISQKNLENLSTKDGKYTNGNWGAKFFRNTEIYDKIIKKGQENFKMLSDILEVKRGFTTGANDFFYLKDNFEKIDKMTDNEFLVYFGKSKEQLSHIWKTCGLYYSEFTHWSHIIEKRYLKPLFKTQKEADKLEVSVDKLKNVVFICNDNENKLAKIKANALSYIKKGIEFQLNELPSMTPRKLWYDISNASMIGDFIFPSKIGEYYRLIDNRKSKVFCDKVNYAMTVKEEYREYEDILFAILNSTLFRYFIDIFSRQLTGAQTLSDVDVNVVKKTLIINPILLKDKKEDISKIINSLKSREQKGILEELKMEDRRLLDKIIFEAIGLEETDLDEFYKVVHQFIIERREKSESVKTVSQKQVLTEEEVIEYIKERFPELQKLNDITKDFALQTYQIPKTKAKFPKDLGMQSLFTPNFNVYFQEGNKQIILTFAHQEQIKLFQWLVEKFDINGVKISLPTSVENCYKTIQTLENHYEELFPQIKNILKIHRSKIPAIVIYKKIVLDGIL